MNTNSTISLEDEIDQEESDLLRSIRDEAYSLAQIIAADYQVTCLNALKIILKHLNSITDGECRYYKQKQIRKIYIKRPKKQRVKKTTTTLPA